MSDAESVAQQRHISRYGIMLDAVYDYVEPDNPALLESPEAVAHISQAVERLRDRGVQDRQIQDIMRVAFIDTRLEKSDFNQPAADQYALRQLAVQRQTGQLYAVSVVHRAEVTGRKIWEQEIFEAEHLARQRRATRQTTPSPSWFNQGKEIATRNAGLTAGVAAAGTVAVLFAARRHHGR